MRILVYWEQESWGGVDTHLLELLSTWPRLGDDIVLMVNSGNRGFARLRADFEALPCVRCVEVASYSHNELNRRFREVRWLRPFSKLLHFFQPLTYCVSVWRLQQQIAREGDFDVLLADNGGYPAAWGAICAIEAAGYVGIRTRVLLVHHAAVPAAPFMGWFERLVDRRVSARVTAIVCVSEATKAALLAHRLIGQETLDLRVIKNGIRPAKEPVEDAAPVNLRAMVGAAPDELLVGIVGRVSAYKGHEDLISAIALLPLVQRQKLRLVVIGASDPLGEDQRLFQVAKKLGIETQVCFTGYLPGRPVSLIAQLSLLVVATRDFEGFGLTLIEAMTVGVPILATRVGAIPEVVDVEVGVLVSPCSPVELATALTQFVSDPLPWRRRATLARQRMRESTVDMASEYRHLFVECLTRQQQKRGI